MNELRSLPSVDKLLNSEEIRPFLGKLPRLWVVQAIRETLESERNRIRARGSAPQDAELLARLCLKLEEQTDLFIQPVINGTGVIIHTNLGRAPLPLDVLQDLTASAQGYCNLEMDLISGKRGDRYQAIEKLLNSLTEAAASIVVNNNAGAVLLTLTALAAGKEVIVSRGELVEIGGGFRIPEVMEASGCRLREVGTTNKTRLADYSRAINENTAAILKVHPSNYRVLGFTEEPERKDLRQLTKDHNLWFIEDLGSGALYHTPGVNQEPLVEEVLPYVDVVTYSGDKLLGGPQAGIISGTTEAMELIRRQPLLRALRIDKLSLLALQGVIRKYLANDLKELPVYSMIHVGLDELSLRADKWLSLIGPGYQGEIVEGESTIGGGSLPGETIPTVLLALTARTLNPPQILKLMRRHNPPIIGRIQDNKILLDPRTVLPEQDEIVGQFLAKGCEH